MSETRATSSEISLRQAAKFRGYVRRYPAFTASAVMTLDARAELALVIVTAVMCALLFGTAGTLRYWQAWIYVSIFSWASALTTVDLMKNARALLAVACG